MILVFAVKQEKVAERLWRERGIGEKKIQLAEACGGVIFHVEQGLRITCTDTPTIDVPT